MKQWKKYLIAAGIPVLILAFILIIQNSVGKEDTERSSVFENESTMNDETKESVEKTNISATDEENSVLATKVAPSGESNTSEEKTNKSEEEIQAEIDDFINTYFKGSTNDIIEEYRDIKNYVKTGLDTDSYVVFTTYKIKVFNIDTLVPGMSSLYVTRDDSGSLTIKEGSDKDEIATYIKKLAEEKDIKKLIKKVNSQLEAAIKKDNSLKVFIDYLK